MTFRLILILISISLIQAVPIQERGIKDTLKKAGKFAGKATFFHPKESGEVGACGRHESDQNLYVALNALMYGDGNSVSEWCFKKVMIHHGEKSTEATINDVCPGCQEKSLDLTPETFSKLASPDAGKIDIQWCVIGTAGCAGGSS